MRAAKKRFQDVKTNPTTDRQTITNRQFYLKQNTSRWSDLNA